MPIDLLRPEWPVAARVKAFTSTRVGGCSGQPWNTLNVGSRVGDRAADVERNRALLAAAADVPGEPAWLHQVHGTRVVQLVDSPTAVVEADAAWTDRPGRVCVVQTADCLPVFLATRAGDRVGVAHAGWRGLAAGVLEATVRALGGDPADLCAWLGPAIGPDVFEVGTDVLAAFGADPADPTPAFRAGRTGHWLADLYALARDRLESVGVCQVGGGTYCTFRDAGRFFSFRRDGVTGRMASMIWIGN